MRNPQPEDLEGHQELMSKQLRTRLKRMKMKPVIQIPVLKESQREKPKQSVSRRNQAGPAGVVKILTQAMRPQMIHQLVGGPPGVAPGEVVLLQQRRKRHSLLNLQRMNLVVKVMTAPRRKAKLSHRLLLLLLPASLLQANGEVVHQRRRERSAQ